ncbi:MAG: NAD(P)/FAD-dependent oxidoreductase [Bacteroidales bacterium]
MINIPREDRKRIVIVGCGFAGLNLAKKLKNSGYQVVLLDKHNYHQFPPLYYQVASAGIEESSILFPVRKIFQKHRDFYFRKAEVKRLDDQRKVLVTSEGELEYDYLVLAFGATNNFFGSKEIAAYTKGMKTIAEVIDLRNSILMNFEKALTSSSEEEKKMHLNLVIVGGGPSGVEISGALSEMNKYIIPRDYPEFGNNRASIYLVEAADRLLGVMSEKSSAKAKKFLEKTGVRVLTSTKVISCNENGVVVEPGGLIPSKLIIWTAGIKGNTIDGLDPEALTRGSRILVDKYSRVKGYSNIFALGDVSCMPDEQNPNGHPQVAQVAIQQASRLASNFRNTLKNKEWEGFRYRDLGTMATVGRNLAVVELPYVHFHGIFAWFVWMFIHLMSIVGVRNKLMIFINWAWKYFTYDHSLRLILRPRGRC